MLDVLTWDDEDEDDEDRWRLLILEDAGELIAVTGQALSRLLNVAHGLLGQGTRTLLLITSNEPVKPLHPAARRPGRCLVDIEFTPALDRRANAWLAARGHEREVQTRPHEPSCSNSNRRPDGGDPGGAGLRVRARTPMTWPPGLAWGRRPAPSAAAPLAARPPRLRSDRRTVSRARRALRHSRPRRRGT
jgi:hypothetical protein